MKKLLKCLVAFFLIFCLAFILVKIGLVGNLVDLLYLESKQLNSYTVPSSGKGTGYFRHCYENLDDTEKQAYALVLQSIKEQPEKIRIPELTSDQLNEVFTALSYDNPDLCCLGGGCKMVNEGRRFYYIPEYPESAEECAALMLQLTEKAEQIAEAASQYEGEYEKEKYVHDYIIDNCSYTDNMTEGYANTAYGALVNGSAACEGYSRAFQLVLAMLDIDTRLVTGQASDGSGEPIGHMWNVAVIDGKNYFVDVTWDDPVSSADTISYAYFNVTGDMISATHTNIVPSGIVCDSTENNYFIKESLYFTDNDSYFENRIISAVGYYYTQGKSSLEFRFSDDGVFKSAKEDLFGGLIRNAFETAGIIAGNEKFMINYSENESVLVFRLYFSK